MFLFYYSRLDKRQGCHEIKTDKNGKGIEAMETISLSSTRYFTKYFSKTDLRQYFDFRPHFPCVQCCFEFFWIRVCGLTFF